MRGELKFVFPIRAGIVALLLCANAAQGQINREQNINRQGCDYTHFTTANADQCQTSCQQDQSCEAYTWVPQAGNQGVCWLKDAVPEPTANTTWVSGVKSHISTELDTNRQGSDYTNFPIASSDQCRFQCTMDAKCQAYTWVPQDAGQGQCWLKNAVPPSSAHASWVSGIKNFGGAWLQPKPQNILQAGVWLLPGNSLISDDGRWKFEFRAADGNLVLYNTVKCDPDGRFFGTDTGHKLSTDQYPLGHVGETECPSASDLHFVSYATMQADGNFVMFQGWQSCNWPTMGNSAIVFQSGTTGHPGAYLKVEDDGNVVIYDPGTAINAIWHRGMWPW